MAEVQFNEVSYLNGVGLQNTPRRVKVEIRKTFLEMMLTMRFGAYEPSAPSVRLQY